MKVLVVDDDTVSRLMLGGLLATLGPTQIVEAEDGEEAWRLLQDGLRPTVCCSDIQMPGLDGLGLIDRVRRDPVLASLPFVLISSVADRATVAAAVSRGAAGYILKPFNVVDTRLTVERVMRQTLAQRREGAHLACRRLRIDMGEFTHLLEVLGADAQALAVTPTMPGQDAVVRIRAACLMLGLWHAAALLEPLASPEPEEAAVQPVLREVARLAMEHRAQEVEAA